MLRPGGVTNVAYDSKQGDKGTHGTRWVGIGLVDEDITGRIDDSDMQGQARSTTVIMMCTTLQCGERYS
jgi:hypothetical protein